jgi:predicted TIM-barrel fold metal-dependent hydrolase
MTRRDFLVSGGAAVALGGTVAAARAKEPAVKAKKKTGYIDAHSHIWTPDTKAYPLKEGTTKKDLDPPSFTTEELLETATPHGVDRVVLIQHHTYYGWNNRYMTDAAAAHPETFRVVGMVDDQSPDPGQQMKKLHKQHVTGFRITPWLRKEKWLEGPGMAEMWKTGAETGQAMCCLIDPPNLPGVDRMCEKYPKTNVVIDHFARIGVDGTIRDKDVSALCRLARHKQTYVKVSAFYALGKKKPPYDDLVPMIRRVFDAFGPQRLMWASDCPYQLASPHTYGASINLVRKRLDFLSKDDKDWLLRRTADQVYFA